MAKLPYLPLYTGDWLKDPAVSLCTPATRGVWIDLLCAMHELDQIGELRGTAEQLARTARCSTAEIVQAVTDLQTTGAAEVAERNGTYCVRNRRMNVAWKERKSAADRQKRHRAKGRHGPVTEESHDSSMSLSISKTPPPTPTPNESAPEPAPLPESWATATADLRKAGMSEAEAACEAARRNGCLPNEVTGLLQHWQASPGAWPMGLLYSKIKTLRPDSKVSWPEPDVAYVKEQAKVEHEQRIHKAAPRPTSEQLAETAAAFKAALTTIESTTAPLPAK